MEKARQEELPLRADVAPDEGVEDEKSLTFARSDVHKSAADALKKHFKYFKYPAKHLWKIKGKCLLQWIVEGLQKYKDAGKGSVDHKFYPTLRSLFSRYENTDQFRAEADDEEDAEAPEETEVVRTAVRWL